MQNNELGECYPKQKEILSHDVGDLGVPSLCLTSNSDNVMSSDFTELLLSVGRQGNSSSHFLE